MNEFRNNHPMPISPRDFSRRVVVAVLITIVIVGLTVFFGFSIDIWFAVYLGILLAIFIRTLSEWVSRYLRLPEKWSVAVVLVFLVCLIGVAGWGLTKPLVEEDRQLQQRLPQAIGYLHQKVQSAGLDRFIPDNLSGGSQLSGTTGKIASEAVHIFSGTLQSVVTVLVVLFLGIYLSFSPALYVNGLVSLFPMDKRDGARRVISETGIKLRHWIFGQIVSMTAVGGMIALGLFISGIPLPLVLGFLAGVLDIIPIFGPVIAAVPAILMGFTISPWHALYAIAVFVVSNQIEQHLLIPIVQRYSVSLPPALTVVALLLMGTLFGFWGLLLAAPLTATALLLVKRIYVGNILGDPNGNK